MRHVDIGRAITDQEDPVFYEDIGWFVLYVPNEFSTVDVAAYHIGGYQEDGNAVFENGAEWKDVDPDVKGFVRWDACSNWEYLPVHFCNSRDVAEFGELMKRIYRDAAQFLPQMEDYDVEENKDVPHDPGV